MRMSRFAETQIVSILKEADTGAKVKDLCRKLLRRQGKAWNHKRISGCIAP